jgi:spermidine/putrescine transport system ATP-binding protein
MPFFAKAKPTELSGFDLQLHHVSKVFNGEIAVQELNLAVRTGEFFSILGPSGCGKTTTLRLVAGFEQPSTGEVVIQDQSMKRVPAHRRPVNTVFQTYALFQHLTVAENVAFGLRISGVKRAERRNRVQEALRLVQMHELADRMPRHLSGGQQQRVALARAIVNRPAVLLLDEPLAALDLKLRQQMQLELVTLQRQLGMTFILVTHDQDEALSLSDRIAVMRQGQIDQVGTPSEVYDHPQTAFVADFIGETNLFWGKAQPQGNFVRVVSDRGLTIFAQSRAEIPETVAVSVRPEKVKLSLKPPQGNVPNCFTGSLESVMYKGTHALLVLRLGSGDRVKVLYPKANVVLPDPLAAVYIAWHPTDALIVWD